MGVVVAIVVRPVVSVSGRAPNGGCCGNLNLIPLNIVGVGIEILQRMFKLLLIVVGLFGTL